MESAHRKIVLCPSSRSRNRFIRDFWERVTNVRSNQVMERSVRYKLKFRLIIHTPLHVRAITCNRWLKPAFLTSLKCRGAEGKELVQISPLLLCSRAQGFERCGEKSGFNSEGYILIKSALFPKDITFSKFRLIKYSRNVIFVQQLVFFKMGVYLEWVLC